MECGKEDWLSALLRLTGMETRVVSVAEAGTPIEVEGITFPLAIMATRGNEHRVADAWQQSNTHCFSANPRLSPKVGMKERP